MNSTPKKTARVLIVDDEEDVRFVLQRVLQNEGYVLETAVDGADAINKINQSDYDLVLLDLYMEPIDGMQVFDAIREKSEEIMVIILTAHGSLDSSVAALRHGAFDYLFKPVTAVMIRKSVRNGLAKRTQIQEKQKALTQMDQLRQLFNEVEKSPSPSTSPPDTPPRFISSGSLLIDTHYQVASFDDRDLDLTTTEYNLLHCLVKRAPDYISARELVLEGMEYDVEDREAREMIKFHIYKLRQKVEPDASRPQHIVTVRYKGYRWRS